MTRYIGLWHGGHSYSSPWAEDAEYFGSLREATDAIRSRRDHGYSWRQTFRNVFRPPSSDLTPVAHSEGSGRLDLFIVDTDPDTWTAEEREGWRDYLSSHDGPDIRLTFGSRGGVVRNV